jgi:drug/metabolite transporter (DMT)-like permease
VSDTTPSAPPDPTPPSGGSGCATALMIVVGIVMLLPGICAIILAGLDPHEMMVDPNVMLALLGMLAIGAGGVALIWWAVRRPSR